MSVIYGSPIVLGGGSSAPFKLVHTFNLKTVEGDNGELKLDLYSNGQLCYLISASDFASKQLQEKYTWRVSEEGIETKYLPQNIEKYGGKYRGYFFGKLLSYSPAAVISMQNFGYFMVEISSESVQIAFFISTSKDYSGTKYQVIISKGTQLLSWPMENS